MKRSIRRVAVLVETSNSYGRDIQRGIADYVKVKGNWSMFVEQHELGTPPPPWLLRQMWDGIISRPTTPALARAFRKLRVPVIDLNDLHQDLGFPRLQSDNHAIGRLAADHLRERGFSHFAFCGFAGEPWSDERRAGFIQTLGPMGIRASCHQTPWRGKHRKPWSQEQALLVRWLKNLQQPVGIFACNDVRGRDVLEAARQLGIAVPDQVAVIGVDNDELLCQMCDPPLSSILPDAYGIGFQAARLLEGLMSSRRGRRFCRRLEPRTIIARQSTDTLAAPDAEVAAAVRFIRQNACSGICVKDVLRQVPLSRSLLDQRFCASIGRTPHAEIRAVQLQRAAQLLGETDLPLKQISAACGFSHMEYLSYLFKRKFANSPKAYRQSHRNAGVAGKLFNRNS